MGSTQATLVCTRLEKTITGTDNYQFCGVDKLSTSNCLLLLMLVPLVCILILWRQVSVVRVAQFSCDELTTRERPDWRAASRGARVLAGCAIAAKYKTIVVRDGEVLYGAWKPHKYICISKYK